MADAIEYIVHVKGLGGDNEDDDSKEKSNSAEPSGLDVFNKVFHPLRHQSDESSKTYFGKEVTRNVISTVSQTVSISVNRYFQLSEDYKGQNYLNNVMSNINRAKGFGSSIVTGAIAGAKVGGGVGMLVGIGISGGTNLIQQAIQYQNTVANFRTALNATRIETLFAAERAGLYNGGKGTEN